MINKKYIKYCIDCNKKLNDFAYWNGQVRCRSCTCKKRLADSTKNPMYGVRRFGKDNPNYKTGQHSFDNHVFCKSCGNEISKNTKHLLCRSCVNKGNQHTFIDGRSLKKIFCKDCGKRISLRAKRCKRCAELNLPKSIKRIKYKKFWMRSSWEVAYAKYLDKNKIQWQYEPRIFEVGKFRYIPDFYLPDTDTYVEIKGRWRNNAKKKFNLFQKMYYSVNIVLLTQKELKKLKIIK